MSVIQRLLPCFVLLILAMNTAAQEQSAAVSPRPPDVRLVIDVSGSMKRNDPNNLRQPAVELLVQLLPEKSRAGVWTFGKWINMLVPHKPVTDAWREAAQKKSEDINSIGLYTNIGEALEKAAYDIKAAKNDYRTSIILLTDGMVDVAKSPDANKREWRRIVDEVLPKLKDAGITIHTIALSDNADKNLLNKLSLSTGGMAEVAHTADDLMRIFLKTFDAAVPSDQVPLTDNQFVVDSSVEEFTALIFRRNPQQKTELIGPDQAVYRHDTETADVKWHRADKYDLITVGRPLEGEWGIKADMAPKSRVTVVSNLNLRVAALPVNVFKGRQETLSLFLQEDGKAIVRPEFLSLMTIDAAMEAGNDEFDLQEFWKQQLAKDEPPADGRYVQTLPLFEKEGIYQLSVLVDGKTFVRQFNHQFTVRQPFGAEVNQQFDNGKLEYELVAHSYNQTIDVGRTRVAATIIAPNGRKKIRSLTATDVDTWKATLLPDIEGEYRARIKVKGIDTDGNEFEITLDDIRFNYSLEGGFVEEEETFFDASPKAEITPAPAASETPEPLPENAIETPPSPQAPIPSWVLYGLLGLGNIVLFGLGFYAFKKVMKDDDNVLEAYSEENVNEEATAPASQEPESEEEPPMEDLDPVIGDAGDEDLDPVVSEPTAKSESEPRMDLDGLDDLDTMDDGGAEPEDDEDMVADMLKAQGLDLAEDELDEAISNLIDDLDGDGQDDEHAENSDDEENKT